MPKYDNQTLLSLWLDNQLTDEQRQIFEQRCLEDEPFAQKVNAANQFVMRADEYQNQPVPDWHREQMLEIEKEARWWQWSAWPAVSMAMSFVALVFVLTGVQLKVTDGSITLALGNASQQAEMEKLVETRLAEMRNQQSDMMTEFAGLIQQQQLQTNSQLTEFLLTSSRQERREDFAELIRFVNQQRTDDQQFYARQINKLQQQIYADDAELDWPVRSQVQQ